MGRDDQDGIDGAAQGGVDEVAAPPPATAHVSEAERLDRELARAALQTIRSGGVPRAREAAALRRVEKAREDEARWRYYRECPKKHYRQMSGRQDKVLNEQAVRYGLPVGGPKVDLVVLVQWLHQFLADHRHDLSRILDANIAALTPKEQLDQIRVERERRRLERESLELVDAEAVRQGHAKLVAMLRRTGERMRAVDEECYLLLQETLEEFEQQVDAGDLGVPPPSGPLGSRDVDDDDNVVQPDA